MKTKRVKNEGKDSQRARSGMVVRSKVKAGRDYELTPGKLEMPN